MSRNPTRDTDRGWCRFRNADKIVGQSTVPSVGHPPSDGAIAQLGERIVRNDEVVGSIPTSSTNLLNHLPSFFAVCVHRKITGCGTFWNVGRARRFLPRRPSKNRGPGQRSAVPLAWLLRLPTPRVVAPVSALIFLQGRYRLRTSNCTVRAIELISGS